MVHVEVVARKIAVPAGEFEAFKLVSKGGQRNIPINSQYDGVITTTYWYLQHRAPS